LKYNVSYGSQAPRPRENSYLFIVGHMRSFSSLLSHILGSHPEISGYVETHQSYYGRTDLNALRRRVRETTGARDDCRYVLDKILHNQFYIAPSILTRPDVKTLFLVRRPEETINSILNMMHSLQGKALRTAEQAMQYYVARLRQLQSYSLQLEAAALFVEAERLIDDTDAVLDGLSRWLELEQPLTAEYKTFQWTGVKGYSDPSPNIKVGTVVSDPEERHRDYVPMDVPQEILQQANEDYATCRELLLRRHNVP
jgi:hypothetical protein